MKFESDFATGNFSGAEGMVHVSLSQLKHYQKIKSSPNPKELDWEVEFMEWVFAGGEERCQLYFDTRYQNGVPIGRRSIAKKMGYGK